MAWTTPRTWVASELVTAALLNTHVRDNLNYLHDNMKPVSIQRGTISFGTGDLTKASAGFTAVSSTGVCEIDKLGSSINTGTNTHTGEEKVRIALTSTTVVTGTRATTTDGAGTARAIDVNFQVTEWPA